MSPPFSAPEASGAPHAPGAHILVVDDDEDILEAITDALGGVGHHVVTARNGVDALDRLRGGLRPCVILLDLMMPVMNGWDFRAQQQSDPALASIPVVVMTGFREMTKRATTLGVASILEKPVDLENLLATIASYC